MHTTKDSWEERFDNAFGSFFALHGDFGQIDEVITRRGDKQFTFMKEMLVNPEQIKSFIKKLLEERDSAQANRARQPVMKSAPKHLE